VPWFIDPGQRLHARLLGHFLHMVGAQEIRNVQAHFDSNGRFRARREGGNPRVLTRKRTACQRNCRYRYRALVCGCAIAWPLASSAQEPKQALKRIGVLAAQVPCPLQPDNLIIRRLAELDWVEGHNFNFEGVSAFGRFDQVPALARELVSWRPDVFMAIPTQFIMALKQETTTVAEV